MEQTTINQRLNFLSEKLASSTRAFGLSIGDNSSNTHKYIHGTTRPSPEYLEKVVLRFREINAFWLLTGEGEPFIPGAAEPSAVHQTPKKISRSLIVGHQSGGTATQNQGPSANEQAAMQRELEFLRSQVADRERTIADKERTIQILLNKL